MLFLYRIRASGTVVLVGILSSRVDLPAQRVRDEVVELSSGDRVTGEIKGLDRSYLTFRTIDLGTVQIRWQRVVRLNSNRMLEIVLVDGRRLQGSVVSPTLRTLDVTGGWRCWVRRFWSERCRSMNPRARKASRSSRRGTRCFSTNIRRRISMSAISSASVSANRVDFSST